MAAARLLLIRHAHIDRPSRLCGSFDVPLSRSGASLVHAIVQQPPSRGIPDALYTSPLTRARDVATVLAEAWALEPRCVDAAREIHCGSVEGMRLDDLQRQYPDLWARNKAQTDDDFAWPDGESYREFRARVLTGFDRIARAHAGERVAIVTHAGVISQILGTICGRPPAVWAADRPAPFTGTEVTWANGSPQAVLTYNDAVWW